MEDLLADKYGAGVVPLPSRATFNRLVAALSTGRHTFGQATTRRSIANRPDGPFTVTWVARNTAATTTHRPVVEPIDTIEDDDTADEVEETDEDATVIPFGVFDARAEAQRWP